MSEQRKFSRPKQKKETDWRSVGLFISCGIYGNARISFNG